MPTLYWPFSTSQVSEWPGPRKNGYHYGTDFAVAQGSILRATVDGVITRHNNDGLGAYVLDIMSDDGLLVRNGHLSRMDVSTGQRVKAGQVIGLTGGRPGTPGAGHSFGPHLHWELRRDRLWSGGAWIDPRNLNPQPLNLRQDPQTSSSKKGKSMQFAIIKETGLGIVFSEFTFLEINPKTDPAEFAAAEAIWGHGANRLYISAEQARIEKIQVSKRRNAVFSSGNQINVTAEVDYAKIAKTVLDEEAKRLQS